MTYPTRHLREANEFTKLAETISIYSIDSLVVYCPSPGNWGDALINAGADQFFDFYSLDVEVKKRDEVLEFITDLERQEKSNVLIVGGGGGWCEPWSSTREFVERVAPFFQQVIILPTTYDLPLLASVNNVTYFSRERRPSHEDTSNVYFCHDMAFFINLDVKKQEPELWRILAFRMDKERSKDARDVAAQIDISLLGNSYSSIEPFFEIINRFNTICTDRLHVAIAASLLGKKCRLFPGSYSKALGVWNASIEYNFPSTLFMEWKESLDMF